MFDETTIDSVIRSRANKIIKTVPVLEKLSFYLAGGCLSGDNYNDIDIFPINNEGFDFDKILDKPIDTVSQTKNATTVRINGKIIQFCNYKKSSLDELVNSFDFAHIQVGCKIIKGRVQEIFYSNQFKVAKVIENSEYIKSEYPLSSLIRILKYFKREKLTKTSAISSIIRIVKDIYTRGFENYEDFKDQIDAVDLGLVPDEFNDLSIPELKELYELLVKNE